MGMNTVAKGNRVENKAKAYLLSTYNIHTEKKNHARYASPDFWGLFDLIGFSKSKWHVVQVKSDMSSFYQARKRIAKWVLIDHIPKGTVVSVLVYKGRNRWRMDVLRNGEWMKVDYYIKYYKV